MGYLKFTLVTLLFCTVFLQCQAVQTGKVRDSLLLSLQTKPNVNIFVVMKEGTFDILQNVASSFTSTSTHGERTTSVYNALVEHSKITQKPVLDFLEKISILSPKSKLKYQSFWINNEIYVQNADDAIISALEEMDEVSVIYEEEILDIKSVFIGKIPTNRLLLSNTRGLRAEWGLEQMSVPQVWSMPGGNNGSGLIVGNIDTGVRASHELLRDKWVGLDGHGWYDPENRTAVPHDVYNHGTLTIGAIVGDRGIGVAPGAHWMACKGYRDDGSGTTSTFVACGQYMLCPVNYQGNNADCSKAPHVVSNSFGLGGGTTAFDSVLQAWITAGILSSFSAGNTGQGNSCSTIYTPADRNDAIAVGATGRNDDLAYFSSLGPSRFGQLKPEISAPGLDIYTSSATSDTAYTAAGGTSLSCPLASGVLVLMKTFDRNLSHDRANSILKQTADRNTPIGVTCGGIQDTVWPNNHIGYGRVNAYKSMQMLMGKI